MTSESFLSLCRARFATKRNPERETLGHEIAAIAKQLGQPLMPWQRLVADVGLELDPATGLPVYREIVVTVPRQSGKTTLVLGWELQRALRWATPQKIAFTAQTGWDARRKLCDDQAPMLLASPLRPAIDRVFRGAGTEAIVFKNGSRIDVLASTEAAGHGRTIDLGVIDEAFADTDDRREQALLPAMATRAAAQILTVSTAGTEASVYLRRKVDAGRAAVLNGEDSGIAYFEWSADDDADIDDAKVWHSTMPALGHIITEQTVLHARQTMSEDDFRRAWLNQWTTSEQRVFPVAVWEKVCSSATHPDGDLVFALDVNPERSAAAIAVGDQSGNVELVEHRPGVTWVVDRMVELATKWNASVVLDGYGPAGSLFDALEGARVRVEKLSSRQVAYACGSFFDAVSDGRISIRIHPALEDAVAAARRRVSGDSWSWARSDTSTDISPLVAITLAFDRATSVKASKQSEIWVSWD